MNKTFCNGDSVACYDNYMRTVGTVYAASPSGVTVMFPEGNIRTFFPQQVRRITKTRKRRVWAVVPSYGVGFVPAFFNKADADKEAKALGQSVMEFVEVHRKKEQPK